MKDDKRKAPETLELQDGSLEPRKLWIDVISGNQNPGNEMAIKFITPKLVDGVIEVESDEADIVNENFEKLPDIYYNDEGYFVLRFHSYQDRDAVLRKGPYTIRNMPILLSKWKPDFNLKRDMLLTILILVKLPQLPIYLWGSKSLSKIGRALGTQLMTDECTENRYRISYARILVEIEITQEIVKEITIKDKTGEKMQQSVEYEWRPPYCIKFQKIGHTYGGKQQKQHTKQLIPKEKDTTKTTGGGNQC
ncbi:uncharacterized protein LOC131618644 [Vicia villosa]|uniref:uncharacterized protein LOC131618644 n=1 Tax=Vicia villosa TaxID=3911 RepID=UPI00273BC0DB|nr:uncharacterized protein LOC131618644 [Vicia villosa]